MSTPINLKQQGIDTAARILLDHQVWSDAKYFVQDMANKDGLSNDQKHEKVKVDLLQIFGDIGTTILDIAIKLAVLWLKNQSEKQ